jgi:hypothetical protein
VNKSVSEHLKEIARLTEPAQQPSMRNAIAEFLRSSARYDLFYVPGLPRAASLHAACSEAVLLLADLWEAGDGAANVLRWLRETKPWMGMPSDGPLGFWRDEIRAWGGDHLARAEAVLDEVSKR